MKRLALLLPAVSAFAAYQYYYSDALTSIDLNRWMQNGSVTATSGGLTAPSANGGSLISRVAVPDGTGEYEVKAVLSLLASGGTYVLYLRASGDALSGPAAAGTYYAVEVQNPTFSGGGCTAGLTAYQRAGGVITVLFTTAVPCRNGMEIRIIVRSGVLFGYVDSICYLWAAQSAIASGQPGAGARETPAGNSISLVQLGPLDRTSPSAVDVHSIGTSAFPSHVDIRWAGVLDDPNGIGLWMYQVRRDGVYLGNIAGNEFTDTTVAPGVTYTYRSTHMTTMPTTP